ncbi:unnamed protein product [Aphis gossypii]|uniref:Uncharacterized protein n=1 Tax=Aphis gossypii TaxID=80765 RepID=A0A9P0NQL5_APHGO|nr:unnamed protein product [Aphis gossypii]
MGRRRRYEGDDYHKRLKVLKNKLEPFRNKHTIKCISEIMKSSSLPRHLDNILRILSSNPSNMTVQKCLQNVADDVTSRNQAKRTLPKLDMTVDLVKKFNQADLNSLVTASNNMNHTYIKPSAFNFNTMSCGNCSGPANTFYKVHDINIDPSANSTDTESRGNISYPAEAVNKMNHVNIDPLVNKFNTINFDKT